MNPSVPSRMIALTLLSVAALAMGGCPLAGKKNSKGPIDFGMRRSGDNSYLAGRVKAKEQANSILHLPRSLRPPFRCEATAGVFDQKRGEALLDGPIFGMELDTPGRVLPPPEFYGVSVQLFAQGASVFSGSHLTAPNRAGEAFFNGVNRVDLAIEHTGGSVDFFARPAGTQPWTALGSVNPSGQPFPVNPTLGLFRGVKGGEVGFDDFRVIQNGPRPDGLSPVQDVIEDVWDAIDTQADVAHRADGPDPDLASAPGELATAAATLDGAMDKLVGILDGAAGKKKKKKKSPEKKALGKLKSGIRQLKSARGKLDKNKSPKSVAKKLQKAVTLQFVAIFELQNIPTPPTSK